MSRRLTNVKPGAFAPEPLQEQALCATSPDPDAWFPDLGESTWERAQNALRTCYGCPVRLECLSGALQRDEREGIWGGYTTRQRDRLVREARQRVQTRRVGEESA